MVTLLPVLSERAAPTLRLDVAGRSALLLWRPALLWASCQPIGG
eukprot:gene18437-11342_t